MKGCKKGRTFQHELIELLLESLNKKDICSKCGKPYVSVNHIKPLFQGGLNKLNNIEFLCDSCMKNTHNLDFIHGNESSYIKAYSSWYLKNNHEQHEKHLIRCRKYYYANKPIGK